MLNCCKKINDFSGELWLLENDPALAGQRKRSRNPQAVAARVARFKDRACASTSLDVECEDGLSLLDQVQAEEPGEIESWRMAELGDSLEDLLEVVRNGGTASLAKMLGCSQRSVQMKIKALVEGADAAAQTELALF